jgi:hypothetical protein
MTNSINNTNYKKEIFIKSTTSLSIFDFNNKEHQDIIFTDTYPALLFTSSIRNIKIKKDDVEKSFEEVFEDFLIDILYEHTGYNYIDDDIAIVITPEDELKDMFNKNYQKNYAYFVAVEDDFFFIFD